MARKDISDYEIVQESAKLLPDYGNMVTVLMERTGQPEKVCMAALLRAEDRGLIECGVSIRFPWLTLKGWALLKQSDDNEDCYTVIGFFEDTEQRFMDFVQASSADEAEDKAVKQNTEGDLVIVGVIKGHHSAQDMFEFIRRRETTAPDTD